MLEVLFYALYRRRLAHLAPRSEPPPLSPASREELVARTLRATPDARRFLAGVFRWKVAHRDIPRENAREWAAWSGWGVPLQELPEEAHAQLEGIMQRWEEALGALPGPCTYLLYIIRPAAYASVRGRRCTSVPLSGDSGTVELTLPRQNSADSVLFRQNRLFPVARVALAELRTVTLALGPAGEKLPDGYDAALRQDCVRLSLDEIRAKHRPAVSYLVVS